jgi:hypothetical protein
MPRKKQTDAEQPELIAEEAAEYIVSPDEEAMRAEYRQRLAEALKDPEFRNIEGFPIGEDEAILALSEPPYYTACPNPFLNEIVEKWRQERAALRDELGLPNDEPAGSKYAIRENMPTKNYHREPFAADVSEGKNDPIYNAHSYHTKVPHKAIMRYILHYTDPGDVILDGFCGTGMTGVAAQICGDKKTIESLGYTVKGDEIIDEGKKTLSRLGARKVILNDLSPAATFISSNYNAHANARAFEREAKRILKEVEEECGWMYETTYTDGKTKGRINFTVWSDVFVCPNCSNEIIFWDIAVDKNKGEVSDTWNCPSCATLLAKNPAKNSGAQKADRAWETIFDQALGVTTRRTKFHPVIINYSMGSKRFEKRPDNEDLSLMQKIDEMPISFWYPSSRMRDGDESRRNDEQGITHVHHFYTHRNLLVLSTIWNKVRQSNEKRCRFWFTSTLTWCGKENRLHLGNYFGKTGGVITSLRGTWYIASLSVETNVIERFRLRLSSSQYESNFRLGDSLISTQSTTSIKLLKDESIDYIFIDPPFGSNLMYSELNYIWEAWLQVINNNISEAIVNKTQRKKLREYQSLMELSFKEFYRLLKSGRWMTVEFHNSQNSVWNSIQEAILFSGFMVADVRTLDKGKATFKQVTTTSAVKQDLVISAYKPTAEFERKFITEAGTSQGAWDFIREHLEHIPLPSLQNGNIEPLSERMPYLLYDRMVAFHIQRGLTVPLSSPEFYQGLSQRFLEREGMVFTAAQAAAYDKLRLQAERVEQLALFVTDESSARQWLRQELEKNPQTYGDLQPKFVQQLHQSKYEDLPELKVILEQAFLQDEKGRWYVPDPERAADLEKLRQNTLLREFNEYRKGKGRLKVFRSEAVRAGFSNAWRERDYDVIVEIAERMPESVLQEDQQLLMYYHNASLRQASQPRQENLL